MQKKLTEILDVDNCVVRDEGGNELAVLRVRRGVVNVERTPFCGLGTYFCILSYLMDLGFDVE